MARILIPLPDHDFDVTEVAVPWEAATRAGHELVFATEAGAEPACDPLLLRGVLFGQLGADPEPKRFYEAMTQTEAFRHPLPWGSLEPGAFEGLLLPGGHAQGMRQYLGSEALQSFVGAFFRLGRPVGAICHGVLLAARARDPETGRSALNGRRTTCLPKYMERLAYFLTAWKLGRYYRTYPLYVEDEVRQALAEAGDFQRGPLTLSARGTAEDDRPAFVLEHDNYVSARWPGDGYLFARRFLALLGSPSSTSAE